MDFGSIFADNAAMVGGFRIQSDLDGLYQNYPWIPLFFTVVVVSGAQLRITYKPPYFL